MQVHQFGPHLGKTHPAWSNLVAKGAAKLLELSRFVMLLVRAAVFRYLRDKAHIRKQANAPFEISCHLLSSGSETQFPILARGVAAIAAVRVEHVPSQLLLTSVSSDHSVQGSRLLSGDLGLRVRSCLGEGEQDPSGQSCHTEGDPKPPPLNPEQAASH